MSLHAVVLLDVAALFVSGSCDYFPAFLITATFIFLNTLTVIFFHCCLSPLLFSVMPGVYELELIATMAFGYASLVHPQNLWPILSVEQKLFCPKHCPQVSVSIKE